MKALILVLAIYSDSLVVDSNMVQQQAILKSQIAEIKIEQKLDSLILKNLLKQIKREPEKTKARLKK